MTQRKLFRSITSGEIIRHPAALIGRLVAVETFLAVRVGHPQIHIAVVGIPCQDHPQIQRHVFQQALIHIASVEFLLAGRDNTVEFCQCDQFDFGKAAVPGTQHDLVKLFNRFLVLMCGGIGQTKIAERLWFFLGKLLHFFQYRNRELGRAGLYEAITENAKYLTIFKIHFGQIGKHP